ncbi:MAG: hypothetical protein GTO45_25440 [Candidatus Aminicenantes bacterium]|nr:hypothetical protein [Candidatus Aminicenantes bacterium]NIM82092.1 hypothetical protein [Candidatus Aminicenantes bacterium]NIN21486.1 hypothetical protein [Candidatus Aminicenantes bacterium]NIN45298.1 hypothetical protein [Candidatus Aminicenantes bacterium]NIN88115.1 hypothetical protein [Candidatus Aminicenantes bacterium]
MQRQTKEIQNKQKVLVLVFVFILVFLFVKGFLQGDDNRFIPKKLPSGFVFAHPPEFYGTYEKPLKDGTLYNYINGGGVVYVNHGFRELTHMVFKDSEQNTITLNIFNLGTPENAKAAFADEAICPNGYTEINIGTVSKSYHYEPDYLVYFIKGKYLVYLSLSNDTLSEKLTTFASEIYRDIL